MYYKKRELNTDIESSIEYLNGNYKGLALLDEFGKPIFGLLNISTGDITVLHETDIVTYNDEPFSEGFSIVKEFENLSAS